MNLSRSHILKSSASLLLILILSTAALAAEKTVVLVPETGGALAEIYAAIVDGIKRESASEIETLQLGKQAGVDEIVAELKERDAGGVITLGAQGRDLAKTLKDYFPTVAGALVAQPGVISGVSLSADPNTLFRHLKQMVPQTKQVFVVYSEAENGWLLSAAREAASNYGLELRAFPATDLRMALRQYRKIFGRAGRGDAVWLPIDKNTVDDSVILPLLLKQAWSREFVLFSSKPSHVKKGALLTFYPDNIGLGSQLVALLRRQQAGMTNAEFLKSVLVAVNSRTAKHLGVSFDAAQKGHIFLLYPPK